jgi:outer membrane immunogenic protein
MKRFLLAGAAFAAMTPAAFAAGPVLEPVDVWSGYFVGIQAGYAFGDLDGDVSTGVAPPLTVDGDYSFEPEFALGGLYYGRNWQSGNWVFGLDSSISLIDIDESTIEGDGNITGSAAVDELDIEASLLGLSRAKVGYAFDSILVFAAAGLATTRFEYAINDYDVGGGLGALIDEDSFAFGFTVGVGVEAKFAENWSARIEYIYAKIEDDIDVVDGPTVIGTDVELELSIVRGGVAYHF